MQIKIGNIQYNDVVYVDLETYQNGLIQLQKGHINYCGNGVLRKIKLSNKEIIMNMHGVCLLENDNIKFVSLENISR